MTYTTLVLYAWAAARCSALYFELGQLYAPVQIIPLLPPKLQQLR